MRLRPKLCSVLDNLPTIVVSFPDRISFAKALVSKMSFLEHAVSRSFIVLSSILQVKQIVNPVVWAAFKSLTILVTGNFYSEEKTEALYISYSRISLEMVIYFPLLCVNTLSPSMLKAL